MKRASTVQQHEKRQWDDPRIRLLKELADPLRLRVIDRLGHGGPATVSDMAGEFEVPLPQLSNHLKRLRDAGMVRVRREGRHAIYELSDPGLEALTPLLDRLTGRIAPQPERPETDFARGRTCYDHLAGRVGVEIYAALLDRDALRSKPDGTVELGPEAASAFGPLGVDPAAVDPGRRRFAFECLDVTELRPHLAGALGDALAEALVTKGWIERDDASRAVTLTATGRRGLKRALGVSGAASATAS
jgi:DNA-binding transcriptional ArsR family regulator